VQCANVHQHFQEKIFFALKIKCTVNAGTTSNRKGQRVLYN